MNWELMNWSFCREFLEKLGRVEDEVDEQKLDQELEKVNIEF